MSTQKTETRTTTFKFEQGDLHVTEKLLQLIDDQTGEVETEVRVSSEMYADNDWLTEDMGNQLVKWMATGDVRDKPDFM